MLVFTFVWEILIMGRKIADSIFMGLVLVLVMAGMAKTFN